MGPHVNGADLFDEYLGGHPGHLGLRTEGGGAGATRGRGDDHDRTRQELLGLHDDVKAVAVSFVADTAR